MENTENKEIVSFETITLRESGMRYTVEYEFKQDGGHAEITEYGIRYIQGGGDERVPNRRAVCDTAKVLILLNRCDVLSWNGFNGPHPKDVLDGIMFSLSASVNGGVKIYARGSENFPEHYREFKDGLYELLKNAQVT